MRRREFLLDLARYSALCAGVPNIWRVTSLPHLVDDPFTLGVASGDPTPGGAVIWTRLAPRIFEPYGGMDGQRARVTWEVAEDEQFSKVVQRGRATAAPELGYSIHADVPGLRADRWYYYRFTLPAGSSPVGRLRTAPSEGAVSPLRFAFASCQHYDFGYYTAYEHMAREDLDLVAHLGDYIYEYGGADGRVRKYASGEVRTLDEYRTRYAQTKSDRSLQKAHARAPWVLTWDDHEVVNNYTGLVSGDAAETTGQMRERRAAAYQAWWENQPVRLTARVWADLTITRSIAWGALARFWVLDTRQYRSDQACGDRLKDVPCAGWADSARTVLGPAQEQWLAAGLGSSAARWQVLANQVTVAPLDQKLGDGVAYWMDSWGGYPASLNRLMDVIAEKAANRTVVITGDIHAHWVSELRKRYDRPDAPTIGAEFTGTSISSEGDGLDAWEVWNDRTRAENPHYKWHNARRGYVVCHVGSDDWKASYRTIPFVTKPDAPLGTPSEWLVHWGQPGIERV